VVPVAAGQAIESIFFILYCFIVNIPQPFPPSATTGASGILAGAHGAATAMEAFLLFDTCLALNSHMHVLVRHNNMCRRGVSSEGEAE
jgi:hypothetical protein